MLHLESVLLAISLTIMAGFAGNAMQNNVKELSADLVNVSGVVKANNPTLKQTKQGPQPAPIYQELPQQPQFEIYPSMTATPMTP